MMRLMILYVNQFKKTASVPKEKPINISGSKIQGVAKKDRNGKYSIKLDKCDDALFQSILDNINSLAK